MQITSRTGWFRRSAVFWPSCVTKIRYVSRERGISCLLMPHPCLVLRSVTSAQRMNSISDCCLFVGCLPVHTKRDGVYQQSKCLQKAHIHPFGSSTRVRY